MQNKANFWRFGAKNKGEPGRQSQSGPFRVVLGIVLAAALAAGAGERVRLENDMLVNLSGQKPAVELADEQNIEGDPRTGQAAPPQTSYSNGWMNWQLYYPLSVAIDLGVAHELSDICYFDVEGDGLLTVAYRDRGDWKELFADDLKQYRRWVSRKANVTTRYLRLTFANPGAQIAEVLLYGTARGERPAAPPRAARERPLMDTFIGTNGFVDDPLERLAACGSLREYHHWQWDEGNTDASYRGYPDHELAWSPSWVSGPGWGWDFDAFYRQLKEAGIEVSPCLQGSALYVVGYNPDRRNDKPILPGGDPTRPESYVAHASYLFQFAARYGATAVDASLLKLKAGQPVRSGLGLVRYIENCNEPDKWWEGRDAHFLPAELAAMCSADYDGHRGTMGHTVGVKNADPTMKLVLGGLARPDVEYLRAMKFWADLHRAGDMPFDVINLHHYSTDAGGQGGQATTGISPEADGLRERFARVVEWRDRCLPGKEVWVSEFGYDTNPKSVFRAPAIGSFSNEEVQAQWLVRSYLALAAAGVDRAQQFMLRDVDAQNTEKFSSSGLTTEKRNSHQPKPSWYYVATLRHVLAGTRFDCEIESGDDRVRIYRFRSDDPSPRHVYAIWCPTANQKEVQGFSFAMPEAAAATLIALQPDSTTGQKTQLHFDNHRIEIDVTERPVFIVVP
ncbi:MAG TPA: hypothetical protein PLU87_10680 [Sedimentisphaerales bacterium]|nr:hypothetical protein [Sedimentisphaerales bacterium]HRS11669.1 hypothetical protein [Sedimentisphaerales bacterium]HRV48332.1 hypothetical protein [Sedimentisphaerales bacterium]